VVGLGRFELPTYGLGNRRSIHLSYSPIYQQTFLVYTSYVNGRSWAVVALPHSRRSQRLDRLDFKQG
jgi:hypothetical protein